MPRRPRRKRVRIRRCVKCGHELPDHFVTCSLYVGENIKVVSVLSPLHLIVDNTKDMSNAQD